jgi:hypothetical protein
MWLAKKKKTSATLISLLSFLLISGLFPSHNVSAATYSGNLKIFV